METDRSSTVVDVKLFKLIGLYRLLCPADRGGFGRRFRRAYRTLMWLVIGSFVVQLAWLRASLHDFQRVMYTAMISTYGLTSTFKAYVLLAHSQRLWTVLDSARFAYTAHGGRRPDFAMVPCRDAVSRMLRVFVAFSTAVLVVWLAVPWFTHEYVPVAGTDGTVRRYRATVFNTWFPLSEHAHNSLSGWTAIYAVEAILFSVGLTGWLLFDSYFVTMCFAFSAQFRTISAGYETLGRRCRHQTPPPPQKSDHCPPQGTHIQIDDVKHLDHFDELISHIQDNQRLMKELDDFFDVIQPLMLVQIVINSFSMITCVFFISLAIFLGQSTINVLIFVSGFGTLTLQLFIYCYGFNHIETAKSTLNLAIYSCNWTEMDLRFKKTMLVAMIMNSAHKRQMKVSPIFIINLELFASVMRKSFSVIPILLNLSE